MNYLTATLNATVHLCTNCGAAVLDTNAHDDFHKAATARAGLADESEERA